MSPVQTFQRVTSGGIEEIMASRPYGIQVSTLRQCNRLPCRFPSWLIISSNKPCLRFSCYYSIHTGISPNCCRVIWMPLSLWLKPIQRKRLYVSPILERIVTPFVCPAGRYWPQNQSAYRGSVRGHEGAAGRLCVPRILQSWGILSALPSISSRLAQWCRWTISFT